MTIEAEIQKLTPSAMVTMYALDATAIGGELKHFCPMTNKLVQQVTWQGQLYEAYPVDATGFDKSGKGPLPRPTLKVANIGGVIGAMCNATEDLVGAKLTRKRTFQRFLDAVNFPDAFYQAGHAVAFTRATTGTYFDASGVMQTAASGAPRFDHDPVTHAPLGLLIEEARTNLLLRNQEIDLGWVDVGTDVTVDAITALDGTLTADLVLDDTGTSRHTRYQSISVSDLSVTYALSVYAKAGPGTRYLTLYMTSGGFQGTNRCGRSFDLSNGTMGTGTNDTAAGVLISSACTPVGGGWYRCEIVGTVGIAGAGALVCAVAVNNVFGGGNIGSSYAGDGTSGFYVWGAQAELGSFATSLIPTTTAAVTRNADVVSLSGAAFADWYNQAEGTVVARASVSSGASTSAQGKAVFYLSDDSSSNLLSCVRADADTLSAAMYVAGVSQVSASGLTITPGVASTYAVAYQANNFRTALNGTLGTLDTVCSVPTVDRLYFGVGYNGANRWLDGTLESLDYYAERLSDADLQTLSAGGTVSASPAMSIDFTTGSLAITYWAGYNPEADPNIHLPDDVYFINRKVSENPVFVEFELVSGLDVQGVKLPRGVVIQNTCRWRYRGAECGYTGGAVADEHDEPTAVLAYDRCSKRLVGCEFRFGTYGELPYGGFPGAGLNRG